MDVPHRVLLKIVFGTRFAHGRSANNQNQRRKAANTHTAPKDTAILTPKPLNVTLRYRSVNPTPSNALGIYATKP